MTAKQSDLQVYVKILIQALADSGVHVSQAIKVVRSFERLIGIHHPEVPRDDLGRVQS